MQNAPITEEEFADAFDRYADAIFRHCYLRVLSRDRARELVKDVFTRVWRFAAAGNEIDSVHLLLYRFAHQAIEESRKPAGATPHAREHVPGLAALGGIADEERGVLVLRYVDGFSLPEISGILGGTLQDHARTLQKGAAALSSLPL